MNWLKDVCALLRHFRAQKTPIFSAGYRSEDGRKHISIAVPAALIVILIVLWFQLR